MMMKLRWLWRRCSCRPRRRWPDFYDVKKMKCPNHELREIREIKVEDDPSELHLLDKRDWDPCQDDQMVDLFSFDRLWNVDVERIMQAMKLDNVVVELCRSRSGARSSLLKTSCISLLEFNEVIRTYSKELLVRFFKGVFQIPLGGLGKGLLIAGAGWFGNSEVGVF
nr:hypothetical protein CFP56_44102 [Quercus suber]